MQPLCSHFVSFRTAGSITEEPQTTGPPQITSIVAYSKGFACACGLGTVHLYEKTDDKDFFKKAREIRVRNKCNFVARVWRLHHQSYTVSVEKLRLSVECVPNVYRHLIWLVELVYCHLVFSLGVTCTAMSSASRWESYLLENHAIVVVDLIFWSPSSDSPRPKQCWPK